MGDRAFMDGSEVRRYDAELARLAAAQSPLRLRIGEALEELFARSGHHRCGFSTRAAYAYERLSRSGRWAGESRTVASRLAALPRIRVALLRREIGWVKAELLARHATPETETELLRMAMSCGVRELRRALREEGEDGEEDRPEEEPVCELSVTLPADEAWELEATRMLIEHMNSGGGIDWVDALLGEGQQTIIGVIDADPLDSAEARRLERWRERVAEIRAESDERATRAEREAVVAMGGPCAGGGHDSDLAALEAEAWRVAGLDGDALPDDVFELDRWLRNAASVLASRDLWIGRLLDRFCRAQGWRRLGYASEGHYVRDRLGMSRSSARARITLARRTRGLAPVMDALSAGLLGFEAAQLLSRVAHDGNATAWVERARRRTFKHLREEVQLVELRIRLGSDWMDTEPPTEQELEQAQAVERSVLCGEYLRKAPGGDRDLAQQAIVQMSARPEPRSSLGKVTVRIRMRESDLIFWRQLEAACREAGIGCSFTKFLVWTFWETWLPHLGTSDKWEEVYRRFLYRCPCPVCFRRDRTLPHLVYRSAGGGDDRENLAAPCAWCHLWGEHLGRLRVLPPASEMRWILGERPILEVRGREKRELQ